MPDADADRIARSRCQARPRAARPAYREDMLCASLANMVVCFHGVEMPVCRIHDAKYARWGADAEAQSELHWAWTRPAAQADEPGSVPQLTPTGV